MAAKLLSDVVVSRKWSGAGDATMEWLGRLLTEEGTDILEASTDALARGTAVYGRADADLVEVQRLMARHHILRLPVLQEGRLVGIVDLVELALRVANEEPEGAGAPIDRAV